jgi:DNA-binding transcriptional ArsR family regulator
MSVANTVTFAALAEPTRLSIIDMLAQRGELTAGDISSGFSSSPSAISQHLRVLREARLVSMHKRAQQRVYRLEPTSITEAQQWLNTRLTQWDTRLDAMEMYINKQKGGNTND